MFLIISPCGQFFPIFASAKFKLEMEKNGVIIGIGEVLFDLLPEGKQLGGAPANFAYHTTCLGCNGVAVSAVGCDSLGDEIVELLTTNGVNHHIARVDAPTGTVRVTLDERGIPCYEICEGVAWDKLQLNDEVLALAKSCDAICFGTLAQRSEMSRKAICDLIDAIPAERNALVIYDINLRQNYYSKELIEASLNRCNILKINDEEFSTIAPMLNFVADDFEVGARELIERYGLKMVVVTCGEKGSLVVTKNEVSKLETPKVEVVDTVGAGDSFTAALCVGLLQGKEIREVHRKAVEVAAFVCKNAGAMPPYEE